LVEQIDSSNKVSKDASCLLIKEVDTSEGKNSHIECFKFDSKLTDASTTAVLIVLDGGPRNFQFLQSVTIQCTRVVADKSYGDFLPSEDASSGKNGPIFKMGARTRKNYQGLALCALYKDGWNESANCPRWAVRSFMEPLFVTSTKDKQEALGLLVVGAVPALEKFRPRLFASIMDICAALSSHALPKLKKKFQKGDGLPIGQFTEVLFKQLYETHPRIIEESEAAYTVAMLQEMFYQIDYNGDGTTNWDEFTSFCVQTGLSVNTNKTTGAAGGGEKAFSLEQYVIEYGEAQLERDHVLSAYRFISLMRYVPETRKILVIPEDADNAMIFDEKFRLYSQLYPSKVHIIGNFRADTNESKVTKVGGGFPRVVIYDIIYLTGREMYCYSSSDHCITVCKEFSSMGGKKVNFQQHNRFYHNLLHLKLCWSAKHELLCSVASDRVIYGWNIDSGAIVFQVSRHTDIVTDFIAVEHLDMFMTCSMDKRIVMWSAVSRRVKGILLGHKRGVRSLSVFDQLLLSSGFECDARLWELVNKDCIAILKGHRNPIVCAKLVCDRAQSEKEHRAITVDESGEFRLWNIYIRERSSEPVLLPTLQIFEMTHPEVPINQFRFLAIPYNPQSSTSYYSDMIACSTKLLHFVPEKNVKEFVAPSATVFNDAASTIVTAYGKTLILYDVSNGQFSAVYEDMCSHDISAICLDGERGRKMYVGTGVGELLLVNSISGMVIDAVHYHSKEITSLCEKNKGGRSCVYSSSLDGHLRLYEENNGKLHLHHSLENAFGLGIGITAVKNVPSLNLLVATGTGKQWGVFHDTSMKKLFIVNMDEVVTSFEIVGASHDKADEEYKTMMNYSSAQLFALEKEALLTLALATVSGIVIYTMCTEDFRGVKTYELLHDQQVYINDLVYMKSPDVSSVNYSSVRSSQQDGAPGYHLIAVTDDGVVCVWDMGMMRFESEAKYRKHYAGAPRRSQAAPTPTAKANPKSKKRIAVATDLESNASASMAGTPYGGMAHIPRSLSMREKRKSSPKRVTMSEDEIHSSNRHPDRHHPPHSDGHAHGHGHGHGHGHTGGRGGAGQHHHKPLHKHHFKHHDLDEEHESSSHYPYQHHGNQQGPHAQHHHSYHEHENESDVHDTHQHHSSDGEHHHKPLDYAAAEAAYERRHSQFAAGHPSLFQGKHHNNGSGDQQNASGGTDSHGGLYPMLRSGTEGGPMRSHHHPHALGGPNGKKMRTMSANWMESNNKDMFPIPRGQKFPSYLRSVRHWMAHSDAIPFLVPMHVHGCLLTLSLDGYHRVWNLDKQCLGELVLPNLTEQMKATSLCKEPGTGWRFILERIPVTKHHIDISNVLVKFLKQTRQV
jgi:WD40 repeat protein